MATKFTPAQQSAIDCRDKTLLVSAAAGSGKTATLTERIIRSLTDEDNPLDITKMLIVTFTRAAASDLKSKISTALSVALARNPSDRHLSKQLILVGSAKICTIDSFYLDIVRSNCHLLSFPYENLSLSPDFRIADNEEMSILSLQTMNTLIEDYYNQEETGEQNFAKFVDNFTDTNNDKDLAKMLIDLYQKILSLSNSETFLDDFINKLKEAETQSLYDTFFGKILKEELLAKYKYYLDFWNLACDSLPNNEPAAKAYLPSFDTDRIYCSEICKALSDTSCNVVELRKLFSEYSPKKAGSLKKEDKDEEFEIFNTLRDKFKKDIKDEAAKSFGFDNDETQLLTTKSLEIVEKLREILKEYDNRIQREKLTRKICEFSDVCRYTKQILISKDGSPTETALLYRNSFDAVYIDEYQDVDEVQDQIFAAISKPNNRFMVGDIKQSIYLFRGAQAKIFSSLRKAFPPLDSKDVTDADGRTVFMSNNFRCDKNIIDFTNTICSALFTQCKNTIDYKPEDNLIFSKIINDETYISSKVTLCLIGYENKEQKDELLLNLPDIDDDDDENYTDEAIYISTEIQKLLAQNKADGTKIEPCDIAILTRTKKTALPLEKALAASGTPVSNNVAFDYFENPEVLLVTSLLSTIDNPYRDIHLAATLRSPIFGFTLDDLIEIRCSADPSYSLYEAAEIYFSSENARQKLLDKCKYFFTKLDEYRVLSQSLSVDRLIRFLYEDLFLLSYASSSADQKKTNLLRLYEYARRFESGSFRGLHNFIGYLNEILSENIQITSDNTESKNAVRIMTIHQSKGLEFPICFICNAAKPFNTKNLKNSIVFEQSIGLGIKTHDESGWARINTPLHRAVEKCILRGETEEEMRILYVALTRAREKLYITAKTKYIDNTLFDAKYDAMCDCRYNVMNQNSYLRWILSAIAKTNCNNFLNIIKIAPGSYSNKIDCFDTNETHTINESEIEDAYKLIKKRFDFVYPYEHATKIPAKLSVSKLYPAVLDKDDDYSEALEETDTELIQLSEKPDFYTHKKATSAAQKGTATHTFLQFCNFENCENYGVKEEISRLCEKGFISRQYADIINVKQIENFFKSDLYKQIKNSAFVRREQRFNLLLPANKFTQNAEFIEQLKNDTLTVQGVIDIFFKDSDNNIILCDYKTDYLTADEFKNPTLATQKLTSRHRQQLTYYAAAIEQICGKFPKQILIYSLPLGKSIAVEVEKL